MGKVQPELREHTMDWLAECHGQTGQVGAGVRGEEEEEAESERRGSGESWRTIRV